MSRIIVYLDDNFLLTELRAPFKVVLHKVLVGKYPEAEVTIKICDGRHEPAMAYLDDLDFLDVDTSIELSSLCNNWLNLYNDYKLCTTGRCKPEDFFKKINKL